MVLKWYKLKNNWYPYTHTSSLFSHSTHHSSGNDFPAFIASEVEGNRLNTAQGYSLLNIMCNRKSDWNSFLVINSILKADLFTAQHPEILTFCKIQQENKFLKYITVHTVVLKAM